MNKLVLKTATGIAAVGLLVATMAPSAFAATTVTVSGNGKGSTNGVTVVSAKKNVVKQNNLTGALTIVESKATTGNNKANGNTGPGDVKIKTGDATSTVMTTVTGGSNEATAPSCGCVGSDTDVSVTGNGKHSMNFVTVISGDTNVVKQNSATIAVTAVSSVANTGGNTANGNTNGGVTVTTGSADSSVTTEVAGGGNTLL